MPKHKETKIVDFTDIQMFDLVADIDSYDFIFLFPSQKNLIKKNHIY